MKVDIQIINLEDLNEKGYGIVYKIDNYIIIKKIDSDEILNKIKKIRRELEKEGKLLDEEEIVKIIKEMRKTL